MSEPESTRKILTLPNLVWLVFILVLGSLGGWFYWQGHQYQPKTNAMEKSARHWQSKLDAQVRANKKTIYITNSRDLNLTQQQTKTVQQLTSLFTDITTYTNTNQYRSLYNSTHKLIKSGDLYKNTLPNPTTLATFGIKSQNVRTQVLVNGPDSYQVIVTYVWYHDYSDMYHPQNMKTSTDIYDVSGHFDHYQKVTLNKEINTNAIVVYYSQIN